MEKTARPSLAISNQYSGLLNPEAPTLAVCEEILDSGRFPLTSGELSVVFVDDPTIARVHADFMGDPSPTDVITFPADPKMASAGEIIISVDHARLRAKELDEPFHKELTLYLIHGWLHLAGFDDRCEADCQKMRAAENEALALVAARKPCNEYRLAEK